MQTHDIIFCVTHGCAITYFLILGLYMMLSKRSIFTENKPRKYLRLHTGYALLCWSVSYLIGIIIFSLQIEDEKFTSLMNMLFDLALCVPSSMLMFYTTAQYEKRSYTHTISYTCMGIVMGIAYAITRDTNIVKIAVLLWIMAALKFAYDFRKEIKNYNKLLADEFADLDHRELRWLRGMFGFLAVYGSVYLLARLTDSGAVMNIGYIVTAMAWGYLVYNIDLQKPIPSFAHVILGEEKAVEDTEAEEEERPSEVEARSARIAAMLKTECEEKRLFLEPDLSINTLALAIGTNRTYVWQYLRSRGMNFNGYINGLRLEYAKTLMAKEDNPNIAQIAHKSGFGSDATFRRIFIEKEGCTPKKYHAERKQRGER